MYDSGKYDTSGSTRRISRTSKDNDFACSQQSVLVAVDRFVQAVNNMQSTILVPSRLQDMDACDEQNEMSRRLPANLDSADLHSFFTMFKDVQNELLWGPFVESPAPSRCDSGRSSPSSLRVMKHVRQFSDNSQVSDSDVESDSVREAADELSLSSPGNNIAAAFRYHLYGLHTVLHELANSADYLSSRYQEEIEASSCSL